MIRSSLPRADLPEIGEIFSPNFLIFSMHTPHGMTDTSGYNEKALLQQVVEGDEKAFRSLFDHYRNKIFSIAYRLVKTAAGAEDVVSEVFIKLWVNRRKLAGLDNFNAYINTVTRNHIFNHLRRLATEEAFIRELLTEEPSHNDTTQLIAYNELKRILDETVNRLPPRQKEVYRLGKLEGLPYGAIASELRISKETVKFHMGEALRAIKASLSGYERAILLILLIKNFF